MIGTSPTFPCVWLVFIRRHKSKNGGFDILGTLVRRYCPPATALKKWMVGVYSVHPEFSFHRVTRQISIIARYCSWLGRSIAPAKDVCIRVIPDKPSGEGATRISHLSSTAEERRQIYPFFSLDTRLDPSPHPRECTSRFGGNDVYRVRSRARAGRRTDIPAGAPNEQK